MERLFHYSDSKYTSNLVIIKNGIELPTIVFLPGIGESLNRSGAAQFGSVKLQLEAIDRRILTYMYADAEKKGYNIVALGANSGYTRAEILGCLKYAKEELKAPLIGALVHSNGGFGLFNQITDEIAGMLDGVVSVATGPIRNTLADDILAKYKIACWLLVSDFDTKVNNNLGDVTEKLHADIEAAGGLSWLTLYGDTSISDDHSILNAVWQNPRIWACTGTQPRMLLSEFLLSNKRGEQVVAPDGQVKYWKPATPQPIPTTPPQSEQEIPTKPEDPVITPTIPPKEDPVITPIPPITPPPVEPTPQKKKVGIRRAVTNANKVRLPPGSPYELPNSLLEIFWKEGSPEHEIFKAPPAHRCAGIDIVEVLDAEGRILGNRYTLDIRDAADNKAPTIVVGPFKY